MVNNSESSIGKLLQSVFLESDKVIDLPELLERKLKEYDLSKTKVISLLNIDKDTFDDIINGNAKQPSLINVLKVADFLEIDLSEATKGVFKNQNNENIGAIEKAKNASFIAKNFDLKKLSKIGFFEDSDDTDYLVNRILNFFSYNSIYEFETQLAIPLFSKSKRKYTDKMKDFWIKSAYRCFSEIKNPNEYNRDALKELIVKIKPYCQDVKNGLFTVCKALYNVGVTVIFQNQLVTTQVRGGTFIVNGKPCIVLTDLFKKYPTIWHTLIHELHHVLYDLESIALETFHLTGDPDLFLIEDKADEFATEYFCGYERYKYIAPHIKNYFIVEKFAKEIEVHPSFVYSSFQYFQDHLSGKNFWGAFGEHFPDYNIAVKSLTPITWKEPSLSEIAKKLKTIFELNEI